MKILILEHEFPYPINSGRIIRTWNFIKALASCHELSLLSGYRNLPDTNDLRNFEPYFKNIWLVNCNRKAKSHGKIKSRIKKFKSMLKKIPWEMDSYYREALNNKFLEVIDKFTFDIIFTRYISQAQYLFRNVDKIKSKTIVDLDDIEVVKDERESAINPYRYKGVYDKYRRLLNLYYYKSFHSRLKLVNRCIVCSNKDKDNIEKNRWVKNAHVIPNSINLSEYNSIKEYTKEVFKNKSILFCGHLGYGPNIDGIKWFIYKIFPLIQKNMPNANLCIIGKNPKGELHDYNNGKSISVFGNVDSVIPYYNKSSLVIVPIRYGSGTRIKILETFACKRPVISTTIGAEGFELISNKHCILEDEPENFAFACINLLNDYNNAKRLSEEGYRFVKDYDINVTSKMIKDLFANA